MNHGDHSGHGGHSMPGMDHGTPSCSMNMLWNNQIQGTCVVFESWYISGPMTMFISCIVIMAISFGYSTLLHSIKSFDRKIALSLYQSTGPIRRDSGLPQTQGGYNAVEGGALAKAGMTRLSLQTRLTRAALYAISVAISFWLMLVAMTYNTYLFSSIIVGAFLGHVMYEDEMDVGSVLAGGNGKGLACH